MKGGKRMKKSVYYIVLAALWGATVLVLAVLLLLFGLFPMSYNFGYSLGGACGHPHLWVMAIGITLLLRPIVWRLIAKESKKFKTTTAIIVLVVGIVWLSMNLAAKLLNDYATAKLTEQYVN